MLLREGPRYLFGCCPGHIHLAPSTQQLEASASIICYFKCLGGPAPDRCKMCCRKGPTYLWRFAKSEGGIVFCGCFRQQDKREQSRWLGWFIRHQHHKPSMQALKKKRYKSFINTNKKITLWGNKKCSPVNISPGHYRHRYKPQVQIPPHHTVFIQAHTNTLIPTVFQ